MDYYCQCMLATLSFSSLIARLQCYMCSGGLKRPVVQARRSSCLTAARCVFNSIHVLDNTMTVEEVSGNLIYCVIASWWPVFFLFVASPCIAWNYYGQDLLVSSSWILASVKYFFITPIPQALSCRSSSFFLFFFLKNFWAEAGTTIWFDLFLLFRGVLSSQVPQSGGF